MDPFHKPPGDLFKDDSDPDEGYVPSMLDKGKRKAEGVSRADCVVTGTDTGGLLEPLEREEVVSRYRKSYHVHSQVQDVSSSDSGTDSMFGSDSDSTPSPVMSIDAPPITDGVATVGSDGDESLYQSISEENPPDDQVCSFNFTQLGYQIRSWVGRWI
jgi:hypothetical protein